MTPEKELRALSRVLEMPEEVLSLLARKISDPGWEMKGSSEGEFVAAPGDRSGGAGGWLMVRPALREMPEKPEKKEAPGRLWCAGDRNGRIHLLAAWDGGRLRGAWLRLPAGEWLELRPGSGHHPLFGPCDELFHHPRFHPTRSHPSSRPPETSGRSVGLLPAQDYSRLETLPPLDRPGALPPGAGGAVLNFLALLMRLDGTKKTRYRGPYPTPALFNTMGRSFAPLAEGVPAGELFSRRETELAFRAEMALNPLDWEPSPFSLFLPHPRILVQLRNGVEGVWLDRMPFRIASGKDPSTAGGARVWREEPGGAGKYGARTSGAGTYGAGTYGAGTSGAGTSGAGTSGAGKNDAGTHEGEKYAVGLVLLGRPWRRFCLLDPRGKILHRSLPALHGRKDGRGRAALHSLWNPVLTGWAVLQAHPVLAPSVLALGRRCRFCWASLPLSMASGTEGGVEIQGGLPRQFQRRKKKEEPGALAMMLVSDVLEAAAPWLKQAAQKELERLADPNPEELHREGERVQKEARQALAEHLPILVNAIQRGEALPDGAA